MHEKLFLLNELTRKKAEANNLLAKCVARSVYLCGFVVAIV